MIKTHKCQNISISLGGKLYRQSQSYQAFKINIRLNPKINDRKTAQKRDKKYKIKEEMVFNQKLFMGQNPRTCTILQR